MRFEIHNDTVNDFLIVEGENIEDVQKKVKKETEKRGWKKEDCWSKLLGD